MNNKRFSLAALGLSAVLLGVSTSANAIWWEWPEQVRDHDSREFVVADPLSFDASAAGLSGAVVNANRHWGRYEGIQGEAAYTVEVPEDWNGGLIMWARGYGGEGETLRRVVPSVPFRNVVLGAGYAWAASSYSANYYDVRAALEDTNKLALEVTDYLEQDWGVDYGSVQQYLIAGGSMGGHTAAVAVEKETRYTARYPVRYEGAMPLCQSEQNEFDWLGDYTRVAQELAGYGDYPQDQFQELLPLILDELFVAVQGENAWEPKGEAGERLFRIAEKLTGGERPIFEYGFRVGGLQYAVLGTGGSDGTLNGILSRNVYDNTWRFYRWTDGRRITWDEWRFNRQVDRERADLLANPIRTDGVRWLPLVKGNFDVPVLTMHTLGDFYVPFKHQQLYRKRAELRGNGDLLVQRAIRAPSHCDFSGTEIATATIDWLTWVNGGPKPGGDEVLDPKVVADPDYGCQFTNNALSVGRENLPACSGD